MTSRRTLGRAGMPLSCHQIRITRDIRRKINEVFSSCVSSTWDFIGLSHLGISPQHLREFLPNLFQMDKTQTYSLLLMKEHLGKCAYWTLILRRNGGKHNCECISV